ncbi:MAG: phosphoribosylanthranilate isomerase [Victivallaceae bacterium]|nr:phosphoribosylanthranilate isomerase [Victivallaceae bacterium]
MQVKICGIQNKYELQTAIDAGADAVGFLVGQLHTSRNFILASTAGRLAQQLPPYMTPVLVTHLTKAEEVEEIMQRANIYTVQLHGVANEEIFKLRDLLPPYGKIIVVEYIKNLKDLLYLEELYPVINAVTLDCYNQETALIGLENGSKTYNWREAAEFVSQCPLPVIIAGGLSEENVAAAIEQTMPYGVDACNRLKDAETQACDREKCINYVKNAKLAFLRETDNNLNSKVDHE